MKTFYLLQRKISNGTYGSLSVVVDVHGKQHALKSIPFEKTSEEQVENEVEIGRFLREVKGVPRMNYFQKREGHYEIFFDLILGESLLDLALRRNKRITTEKKIRKIIRNLAKIVRKIHRMGVAHRDIKVNILIS
jgi:serine/threonine protein kinase